jgi:hypothetical protein
MPNWRNSFLGLLVTTTKNRWVGGWVLKHYMRLQVLYWGSIRIPASLSSGCANCDKGGSERRCKNRTSCLLGESERPGVGGASTICLICWTGNWYPAAATPVPKSDPAFSHQKPIILVSFPLHRKEQRLSFLKRNLTKTIFSLSLSLSLSHTHTHTHTYLSCGLNWASSCVCEGLFFSLRNFTKPYAKIMRSWEETVMQRWDCH